MKRLGFWDGDDLDMQAVDAFFTKENELRTELNKLLAEKRKLDNPEALLRAIHEKRKKASKIKQAETKARREKERQEKADRWKQQKEKDILFLGKGFSNSLRDKKSDTERLKENGLEVLSSAYGISEAMSISIADLKFLAYARKNSKTTNYHRFYIPKRRGGKRMISAPLPKLKNAQHWILHNILNKVEVHPAANGCVIGRSILSNAEVHQQKAVVINQDLKDFFPTITYERVRGMFRSLGYSGQVSTIFALICTEPHTIDIEVYGERFFSQRGKRFLPQGSPCSPAIANIITRKMDKRLDGLARKYGFDYTRYVDDLTFSGGPDQLTDITSVLKFSRRIVRDENFELHPEKLKVMKKGGQQSVTGIVVNEKLNVNSKTWRRFKALIYHIEKDGIEGKTWNGETDLLPIIHGYANFINQVNPERGAMIVPRVKAILATYNYKPQNPYSRKKRIDNQKGIIDSVFNTLKGFFKKKD
ncbi:MAG: reverse transcriptase family protein [Bacteroidota bacterium]